MTGTEVGAAAPAVAELLVVTGMSGAGRSTAAQVLEDIGWFAVSNLPPVLLPQLLDLLGGRPETPSHVVVVADVRSRSFFTDLTDVLTSLPVHGPRVRVLFLEAEDDVLVRRFESSRRPHPLQGDGRLLDGITVERELLAELRGTADVVLDTSRLNVHQLAAAVRHAFPADADSLALRVTVVSFGFKYGLPVDADSVTDVRFLPNPFWIPELRALSGLDAPVADHVLAQDGAREVLAGVADLVALAGAGYVREGKYHATAAIGCTGGRHRSVALAEALGRELSRRGLVTRVVHRDLGRE
jgi:UPF0042 nucleotide-binding protein